MSRNKVIVTERIAEEGIDLLKQELDVNYCDGISRGELLDIIDQYDALVVRSVTQVDKELVSRGKKLKVVGRAGNGVDNIDVDTCTRLGIIVANTPDSNTISAAEQTISLLLSTARKTAAASKTLKGGIWDRKPFRGVELYGKKVGIVGLGRIGSMVATRLKSFNMEVMSYDPYITNERFERFGVIKTQTLEELMQEVDILTIHTPRNEETMYLIDEKMLDLARDGLIVINCARGGIVKEEALRLALETGKVWGAGLDVFEQEPATENPLFSFSNVVCTPHLGADTYEAQRRVGENISEQVIKALRGELVPNVVNLPTMLSDELKYLQAYIALVEKMGNIYYQLEKSPISKVELTFSGPIAEHETEILSIGFLKGIMEPIMGDKVNYVNARLMAEDRGIAVFDRKEAQSPKRYKNLITAKIQNKECKLDLEGTLSRARLPLLVDYNGYEIESTLEGYVLVVENEDRPGVIGPFASLLGEEGINIASMKVSRKDKGGIAVMIVNVDQKVDERVLNRLLSVDGITSAKIVHFV